MKYVGGKKIKIKILKAHYLLKKSVKLKNRGSMRNYTRLYTDNFCKISSNSNQEHNWVDRHTDRQINMSHIYKSPRLLWVLTYTFCNIFGKSGLFSFVNAVNSVTLCNLCHFTMCFEIFTVELIIISFVIFRIWCSVEELPAESYKSSGAMDTYCTVK